MEENQENTETQVNPEPQMEEKSSNPEVGFPLSQQKEKKNKGTLIFIILGIVILVGGIIFFVTKGKSQSGMVSPTPSSGGITINTPVPTETPEAKAKADIKIEVLNGTGTTGDAGYLQAKLKTLGYTDVKVGNASEQNQTVTVVTFGDSIDEVNKKAIQEELEMLYEDVTVKTSTNIDFDASIVTGLKKGQTIKPSATATPTATSKATPKATTSASPSATSTATATPTATPVN